MPFIDIRSVTPLEVLPGCRMRTPYGDNMMLSYLEMDENAVVPLHSHPHEQGGMLLKGRMELTDEMDRLRFELYAECTVLLPKMEPSI